MTNDETAFREVDQAIAEDQQWEFLRKHGLLLIGGAAAIVLGVAGWQFLDAQKRGEAAKAAIAFNAASKQLAEDPEIGRASMEKIAAEGPEGYAALAAMTNAGALAAVGETQQALAAYRSIYEGSASRRLKELARLRAATLAMPDGRDAVLADLGDLVESADPFGHYARELAALAALEAKDYETAYAMFLKAAQDEAAPAPIRQRSEEFAALALAAKSGVNITGEMQASDLLRSLENATGGADPHAGHDHGPEGEEQQDQ